MAALLQDIIRDETFYSFVKIFITFDKKNKGYISYTLNSLKHSM